MKLYSNKFRRFHYIRRCVECETRMYDSGDIPPFETPDNMSFEFLERNHTTCCGKATIVAHLVFYCD